MAQSDKKKAEYRRSLDPRVREALDSFEAAYDAKISMGLHKEWRQYEDYCRGKQNPKRDDDHPGSVTNIIFPNIASQVADLVDQPVEILVTGEEPGDQQYSSDIKHLLGWIHHHNKMFSKMDRAEWRRLKMGTVPWKVYYDPAGMYGKGMIVIEPLNPANFYPDPKIKESWALQEGDFMIHATYKPINFLKSHPVYRKVAQDIRPDIAPKYDLTIFQDEDVETIKEIISNRALVIEMWKRGDKNELIRRVIVDEKLAYDSERDPQIGSKGFYKHAQYPFVLNTCYPVEGRLWGMGDAELLIPTQDLINELDDQILANARLMGNIQVVVGLASGINIKKWTRKPGLRIPARDHEAWKVVQPATMPAYIAERRSTGFKEGELVSGRSDLVEGRHKGSLRAASAILALQEAGNRRARHKKLNTEECLSQIYDLTVEYIKEFFDQDRAYRIIGKNLEQVDYIWFNGSNLNKVPRMMQTIDPMSGMPSWMPLIGNEGTPMTKEAHYDVRVSIGAGLPHNEAFLYQAILELQSRQILTNLEARKLLRDFLDWPVINPEEPMLSPNVPEPGAAAFPGMMGGMEGMMGGPGPQEEGAFNPNEIPPEIMNQLLSTLGQRGGQ